MRRSSVALWLGATVATAVIAGAANAASVTYSFDFSMSNNNVANAATGGQYTVEVSDLGFNAGTGAHQVSFMFRNASDGAQSSITRVYFEDGALLGIAQVNNGDGVHFKSPDDPGPFPGPNNPPAANGAPDRPFATTVDFLAKSAPAVEPNGVGNGEWVEIIFDLKPGKDFSSIISSIEAGLAGDFSGDSLRIAMHVQGFGNGGSETFIMTGGNGTVIPLPAPLAMGLVGLLGVAAFRSRKLITTS